MKCIMVFSILLMFTSVAFANEDFSELSLDDILKLTIGEASVSKTVDKKTEVSIAINAISQDYIIRSGLTTLADSLRLAPGLDIIHYDNNEWAMAIRANGTGHGQFFGKLLVLLDGQDRYLIQPSLGSTEIK